PQKLEKKLRRAPSRSTKTAKPQPFGTGEQASIIIFKLRGGSYSRVLVRPSLSPPATGQNFYKSTDAMSCAAELEADRARLAEIEEQLLDLLESVRILRLQRKIIQKRLDAFKYPVLTLPNEITSEIFIHSLPPYPECPPMTGNSSPTHLTHICRRWRDIALTTPTLWRAIKLDDAIHDKGGAQEALEAWLSRSGSCPLSIYVNVNDAPLHEAIQSLNVHRARWEYLHLRDVSSETVSFLCGATSSLRYLLITLNDTPSPPVRFNLSPLLRSVVLGYNVSDISLPWQQLTSLTLESAFARDCSTILQKTVNLLHCKISLFSGTSEESKSDAVFLPRLESLALDTVEIDDDDEEPATAYLEALILPALRKLEVEEAYLGSDPIRALGSFFSTSGCKLQELQISRRESLPEDLYRSAFPSIPKIIFRPY
ncbi:hypothetical protein C8R43DRAFT_1194563, partial [Mycena crocata]